MKFTKKNIQSPYNWEKMFEGQNGFLGDVTGLPTEPGNKWVEAAKTILCDRYNHLLRSWAEIEQEKRRLYAELPIRQFLAKNPLSHKIAQNFLGVLMIGIEGMSWSNAAYFAQQALGEDHCWGPMMLAFPIVLIPFAIKFFADEFGKSRAIINKVLFVIFAVAAIGFCWQYAQKYAVIDNTTSLLTTDWNSAGGSAASTPPAKDLKSYLAFQLVVECIVTYVFATWFSKLSKPSTYPQHKAISKLIDQKNDELNVIQSELSVVKFHAIRMGAIFNGVFDPKTESFYLIQ